MHAYLLYIFGPIILLPITGPFFSIFGLNPNWLNLEVSANLATVIVPIVFGGYYIKTVLPKLAYSDDGRDGYDRLRLLPLFLLFALTGSFVKFLGMDFRLLAQEYGINIAYSLASIVCPLLLFFKLQPRVLDITIKLLALLFIASSGSKLSVITILLMFIFLTDFRSWLSIPSYFLVIPL